MTARWLAPLQLDCDSGRMRPLYSLSSPSPLLNYDVNVNVKNVACDGSIYCLSSQSIRVSNRQPSVVSQIVAVRRSQTMTEQYRYAKKKTMRFGSKSFDSVNRRRRRLAACLRGGEMSETAVGMPAEYD
ncbi:unnamed protein product [Haemonchus placei]|uniref:CCT domain-containing protein n=1 Tax=Haemonchus placei TaxID=6290 RepID=A0A0N4X5C3_HAEPC|nr:unnamed protein product [Haemonchus placei]